MKGASKTAEMVAAVRAAYHYGPEAALFDDPFASRMLGPVFRLKCTVPFLREHYMRQGMFKHLKSSLSVLSRARYCEEQLVQGVAGGIRQYVLLGAGFDTFALRADDRFSALTVFEVDTPESQAVKRKRVAACNRQTKVHHRFVPVDFTRDKVEEQLVANGFDPESPSFFSWQGVLIYLDKRTILRSLEGLATIAVGGSRLIADFMDGRLFETGYLRTIPEIAEDVQRLMDYTAARGEPIVSGFVPAEFGELAQSAGWKLMNAVTSRDHAAPYLDGEPDYRWPTEYDHLVTLERVQ